MEEELKIIEESNNQKNNELETEKTQSTKDDEIITKLPEWNIEPPLEIKRGI